MIESPISVSIASSEIVTRNHDNHPDHRRLIGIFLVAPYVISRCAKLTRTRLEARLPNLSWNT